MPVVRSIIRNSSNSVLFTVILILISCVAGSVLYLNQELFIQDFRDLSSLLPLCFGILAISILTDLFTSFIILLLSCYFPFEDNLSERKSLYVSNAIKKFWKHLKSHEYLWRFICALAALFLTWLFRGLKINWSYILVIISTSLLYTCLNLWRDYDDVDLSSSQNLEQSIGAFWAYGAYLAFYKKVLLDITKRMSKFEESCKVLLLVKKLVIICPLSCNANGSLESKDGNISFFEDLPEIIVDEGANNNRYLKTSVYKISGPNLENAYVAAEIPSPLATLYEMRDVMDNTILQYHRACFIKTLKDLLKSDQCIILEYDDLKESPEPLHSFLLSKLEDKKFVNVIK